MHDIKSLELEWRKYKTQKRKPIFLAFMFITIIGLLTFNYKSLITSKFNKYYHNSHISSLNTKNTVLLNNEFIELEINKVIKKNINFKNENSVLVDIPILDKNLIEHTASSKLNIIQSNSVSAYIDVENRFKQSKNIDDSFFLAKSYYEKHDYEKSAYWALETNKLDDTLEEGIFIFINSKVKLGQKNEAISILKKYIEKTNTVEAKNLLYNIENN